MCVSVEPVVSETNASLDALYDEGGAVIIVVVGDAARLAANAPRWTPCANARDAMALFTSTLLPHLPIAAYLGGLC